MRCKSLFVCHLQIEKGEATWSCEKIWKILNFWKFKARKAFLNEFLRISVRKRIYFDIFLKISSFELFY